MTNLAPSVTKADHHSSGYSEYYEAPIPKVGEGEVDDAKVFGETRLSKGCVVDVGIIGEIIVEEGMSMVKPVAEMLMKIWSMICSVGCDARFAKHWVALYCYCIFFAAT